MRTTHWMKGLLLASLPLAALAVEADGGAAAVPQQDGPTLVATATPAAHPLLQEMQTLTGEREAFARDFDWGQPADRAERQRTYAAAMAEFDRRALQAKAAWLRAEGRVDEATVLEARLERPATREHREELPLDRQSGETVEAERGEAIR